LEGIAQEQVVTVHIAGIKSDVMAEAIRDRLTVSVDPGKGHSLRSSAHGGRMTALLAFVKDPNVFAKRINFGTVHSVKNRVITIVAKAIDGLPPADADPVDKALFELKSPDLFRRSEAARRLKEMRPDERREQVARALVALLNDDNVFT